MDSTKRFCFNFMYLRIAKEKERGERVTENSLTTVHIRFFDILGPFSSFRHVLQYQMKKK